MDFSGLDIAVGAILILSAIVAFVRGFVTEVLSLAAWGGAVVLTILFNQPLTDWVEGWIGVAWLARAVSFAFLFFLALSVLKFIVGKIGGMVRESPLGVVDRPMGAAFGILRGFVLISFVFLIYSLLLQPKEPPTWIAEAKTGPAIMDGANMMAQMMYGGEGGESPTQVLERLKKRAQDMAIENALKNTGYSEEDRKSLDSLTKAANGSGD